MCRKRLILCLNSFFAVSGCGLYTPAKDLIKSESPDPDDFTTAQGNYESDIVIHLTCEIAKGLKAADAGFHLNWLDNWGTTITQSITAEDQSGISPGLSAISPLHNVTFPFSVGGNVTSPQSFSFSLGGTASANALRTETIQYTFRNADIKKYAKGDCAHFQDGIFIDGDLKIDQFIYDKAVIANSGNASLYTNGSSLVRRPPFNTFTDEITFVAAFGGSITPTWKLARVTANTSSNLFVAERTVTNDLVVTLGPVEDIQNLKPGDPLALTQSAMTQHTTRVQASAIAVSVSGQSH